MDNPTKMKLAGAVVLVLGAGFFVYSQATSFSALPERAEPVRAAAPGADPRPRGEGPGGWRNMTSEQREARRAEMEKELGLTDEQKKKIEELRGSNDGPPSPENMRAMNEILTPEQREKMRSRMESRMRARMSEDAKLLPPEERAKFEEKLEERMKEMRERFERGEGPPFGGPPPR